jgi:hypothetical protein
LAKSSLLSKGINDKKEGDFEEKEVNGDMAKHEVVKICLPEKGSFFKKRR